jgi:hypothetical protein
MRTKDQLLFQPDPSFDWKAPADTDPELGNYFNGTISKELSDNDGRLIGQDIHEAYFENEVNNESDYLNEIARLVGIYTGNKSAPTRRDMLLLFCGFKAATFFDKMNNTHTERLKSNPHIRKGIFSLDELLDMAVQEAATNVKNEKRS